MIIQLIVVTVFFGIVGMRLTFFSQAAPAPNPTIGARACFTGLNVALVIDTSGSMGGLTSEVKEASQGMINELLPNSKTYFSVISFAENATIRQGFTNSPANLTNALNGLSGSTALRTDFTSGLNAAFSALQQPGTPGAPGIVIFITDGAGNVNQDQYEQAANRIKATGTRVIVLFTERSFYGSNGRGITTAELTAANSWAGIMTDISGPNINLNKRWSDGQNNQSLTVGSTVFHKRTPSVQDDVIIVDYSFSELGQSLRQVAGSACNPNGGGTGNGTGGTGTGTGTGGTGTGTGGTGTGSNGSGTGSGTTTAASNSLAPSRTSNSSQAPTISPNPSPAPTPSAITSDQQSPAPSPSGQGSQVKPPNEQPSPFFDGQMYKKESLQDSIGVIYPKQTLSRWQLFVIVLSTLILLIIIGFTFKYKFRKTEKNSIKS